MVLLLLNIMEKQMKDFNTKKLKKIKPLGSTTPWAWAIETTFGCNLKCWHCSCRIMENHTNPEKRGQYNFMTLDTWTNLFEIINKVAPTTRIDLCLAGEPTLHPDLVKFMNVAREISPFSQIQITTNGTQIFKGRYSYKELLEAGANIIYTDMYNSRKKLIKLAEDSGYYWYEYYKKPENALSPWTYHNPDIKMIILQENPSNWPASRRRAGLLGTWYNHLDWEVAAKFGITPVVEAPHRRCNQPYIYVPVDYKGEYLLCCQDNWHESGGLFGSVNENGVEGFKDYWYGEKMQTIRNRLRDKNRRDTSFCSKCNITFSRCDYKYWKNEEGEAILKNYYNNSEWKTLKDLSGTPDINAKSC